VNPDEHEHPALSQSTTLSGCGILSDAVILLRAADSAQSNDAAVAASKSTAIFARHGTTRRMPGFADTMELNFHARLPADSSHDFHEELKTRRTLLHLAVPPCRRIVAILPHPFIAGTFLHAVLASVQWTMKSDLTL
jgi:hypothetical protein